MKSLDQIPDHIKTAFPAEVRLALEVFTPKEAKELECYFQLETGLFDCIGFSGPDGKVTKPADPIKYNALLVLEEQIRLELYGLQLK